MKNLVICLFICIGLWSCDQKKSTFFIIEGVIEGVNDSTLVYVSYLTENNGKWKEVSDTAYLKNSKFYLKGSINELTGAYLICDNIVIPLYLEPTIIRLVIDKNNPYDYELSGTSIEKESIELRNLLSEDMKIYDSIGDSIQKIFNQIDLHDNEASIIADLKQRAYHFKDAAIMNAKKLDSIQLNFIVKHNTYQIAPYLLYRLSRNNIISNDTIVAIYNSLPKQTKTTLMGRLASAQIQETELSLNKKNILVGDIAPDFSKKSIHGEIIRLSDFRNKNYVLLDFWASWCGPCLKAIPQLKKIQNDYSNKGLKIIGISSDGDEQDWCNTVEKYQLESWVHISSYIDPNDYFCNANDLSIIYDIKSIPVYILIDKHGKVCARWQHIGNAELDFIDKFLVNNKGL